MPVHNGKNEYPSWDAANYISLKVAQKLGYILEREYYAFRSKI